MTDCYFCKNFCLADRKNFDHLYFCCHISFRNFINRLYRQQEQVFLLLLNKKIQKKFFQSLLANFFGDLIFSSSYQSIFFKIVQVIIITNLSKTKKGFQGISLTSTLPTGRGNFAKCNTFRSACYSTFLEDWINIQNQNFCSDSRYILKSSVMPIRATRMNENDKRVQLYTPKQNIAVKRLYLRSTAMYDLMDLENFVKLSLKKHIKSDIMAKGQWYNQYHRPNTRSLFKQPSYPPIRL